MGRASIWPLSSSSPYQSNAIPAMYSTATNTNRMAERISAEFLKSSLPQRQFLVSHDQCNGSLRLFLTVQIPVQFRVEMPQALLLLTPHGTCQNPSNGCLFARSGSSSESWSRTSPRFGGSPMAGVLGIRPDFTAWYPCLRASPSSPAPSNPDHPRGEPGSWCRNRTISGSVGCGMKRIRNAPSGCRPIWTLGKMPVAQLSVSCPSVKALVTETKPV